MSACPACGAPVRRSRIRGVGSLHECRSCGHATAVPDRPARESTYDRDYVVRNYLERADERGPDYDFLVGVLERHRPGGRVLDVGCGPGLLLERLESRGHAVEGIEASAAAVEEARRRVHGPVHHADAGLLAQARGFDAVLFADVLGHLPDPGGALEAAAGALAPGGVVVVQAPDFHSPWHRLARRLSRLLRRDLVHAATIPHRYSPRSLRTAMERVGLTVVDGGHRTLAAARALRVRPGTRGLFDRLRRALARRSDREEFWLVGRRT